MTRDVGWLVRFANTGHRFWSGHGDLTLDGVTYGGLGGLVELGASETDAQTATRLGVSVKAADPTLAASVLQDHGPSDVVVCWIWSADGGITWQPLDHEFRGRLSRPVLEAGVYRIEIEMYRGDIDRGRPLRWNDETQRIRAPGDTGMSRMRRLADGVRVTWPPTTTPD
ncbi:hypothetical protein [Candidatus Palauibacter sp.]|uniref:hypothetical protein n=1 Tax=Candidatus Palauibacter sp. TaxID=3101350 RepID=UPI003CC69C04